MLYSLDTQGLDSALNLQRAGTNQLAFRHLSVWSLTRTVLSSSSFVCRQTTRSVEASQVLVSLSRLTRPLSPLGGRCCGHSSTMWRTVCSRAPHSHLADSLSLHFFMATPKRPTPVLRRFSIVHCLRGNSRPRTPSGSPMKRCSLDGAADCHSSLHWALSQACLLTLAGVERMRCRACSAKGRRDLRRASGGLSETVLWRRWSSLA